jgi:Protein of unknown function (DUF3050)
LYNELRAVGSRLFSAHAADIRPGFDWLRKQKQRGFSPGQFQLYRDNYFYRTSTTVEAVARVALLAVLNKDRPSMADLGRNFYEETGEGCAKDAHPCLLEESHNRVAKRVFGLEPLPLYEADQSPFLLAEARFYRQTQRSLLEASEYVTALATSFAQETAATDMLRTFYESLFLPYKGCFPPEEFSKVSHYFTLHIGGMEQNHSQMAGEGLARVCRDERDVRIAADAMQTFLAAQAALWIALTDAMRTVGGCLVPTSTSPEVNANEG